MKSLLRSAAGLTLRDQQGPLRLSEHKQAVKRGDSKDGTAVHAHGSHKGTDRDGPTVKRRVTSHWQRRAIQKPLRSPAVARQ